MGGHTPSVAAPADIAIPAPPTRDPRHTAPMAVALWVLGDTEAEVAAELERLRLLPAGRLLPCTGRARWMQRAEAPDPPPPTTEAATPDA